MTETFHMVVMRQDSNDVGLLLVTGHDIPLGGNKKHSLNLPKTKRIKIIFATTLKLRFMRWSLFNHCHHCSNYGRFFIPFCYYCMFFLSA